MAGYLGWPIAHSITLCRQSVIYLPSAKLLVVSSLKMLLDRTEGPDEAEDMEARLVRAESKPETLALKLELTGVYNESRQESWHLRCSAVADWRLSNELLDPLRHWEQHPLLWEHGKAHNELFFNGRPGNPRAAAGALYERHLRETWGYISPTRFLNHADRWDLSSLLDGGYGQLAAGPAPLLDVYASVMGDHGVQTNALEAVGPRPTEAQLGWFADGREFALLTLGPSGYVIAMDFAAEQVS